MNNHRFVCVAFAIGALVTSSVALNAQADLPSPKVREKTVADAARIAAERNTTTALPATLPNPFIPREIEVPVDITPATAPAAPSLAGAELLAILAARIPSTGTVSIGGDPILLLGQKRLKVGDTLTISFEGQSYELSIAGVTSTSFTVKRGENIHTRPVRISAASTNTPNNRP